MGKETIPLCVPPVRKDALPSPFSQLQACNYDGSEDLLNLLRAITASLKWPPRWIPPEVVNSAPVLTDSVVPSHDRANSDGEQQVSNESHGVALERLFCTPDRQAVRFRHHALTASESAMNDIFRAVVKVREAAED